MCSCVLWKRNILVPLYMYYGLEMLLEIYFLLSSPVVVLKSNNKKSGGHL